MPILDIHSQIFPSFPIHHHQRLFALGSSSTVFAIMANFLASIFGTELDKVNCSFYFVSLPVFYASGLLAVTDLRALFRKSARAVTVIVALESMSSRHIVRRFSCPTFTRTRHTTPRTE